jgi:PAS domain S-box-containing protein
MNDKLIYQELENQIAELKKQNEILRLHSSLQKEDEIGSYYKTTLNNIGDPVFVKDDQSRLLIVNDAFCKIFGLSRADIIGKTLAEDVPSDERENFLRIDKQVIADGVENINEETLTVRGGQTRIISTRKTRFVDSYGNNFLVGVIRDITDRKKSEENLQISEAQFRGLFIQSHIGSALVGMDKCMIKCNEAFCQLFGYTEEELIGKTIADLTYPQDRDLGMKDLKRLVKGEIQSVLVQKRYVRKDGTIALGELTVSLVRDEDNKPLYFLPVILDITKRNEVEKALRESEKKYNDLFEKSKDGNLIIENGEFIECNQAIVKLLGYNNKSEILDVHPSELSPEIQPDGKRSYEKANEMMNIALEKGSHRFEWIHKKADGKVFPVEVLLTVINNQEKIIHTVWRDITEQKLAEKTLKENESHLQELNYTKDKLFSIIAHDLRSPFNSILGFSELLIENVGDFGLEESLEYLTIINSSANSTLILLDNLLNWAKTQTGQISFKPEKIIFSNVILEIIKLEKSLATAKDISLNYFSSDEIEIVADENMLKTVLRNLISNAIKFTKSGGRISVSAISKQDHVEITISDDGIGMNKEKLKGLFNISSNTTTMGTANEKGSGLGLVLCKEFVEKHKGEIWVESKEGKGSDFKFTLPLNK